MNHPKSASDSPRIKALQELCVAYHYVKLAAKLESAEFDKMIEFVEDNDHLGHLEFEYAVNRMHVCKPRSAHWSIIEELLVSCNARVHITQKEERA